MTVNGLIGCRLRNMQADHIIVGGLVEIAVGWLMNLPSA